MAWESPFELTVYDSSLNRRGWIGAPAAVELVPRHNAIGYAKITVDSRHPRVPDLVLPGARMTVRYLDDMLMSGRVGRVEGKGPRAQETVTVTIEDDFRLLSRLLGWPNPAGTLAQQGAATAYDTVSGPAETVVKTLVQRNAARSRPTVQVAASSGRGAVIQASVRMHPLADRILTAVDAAGVGVTVIQGSSGLVVDCYAPPPVPRVITEQGGQVVDWSWTTTGPSATRVVIGGQGEGTAREFVQVIDTDRETAWGETVEVFRDARDTDDDAVLAQRGQETLAEGAPTTGLSLTLAESRGFRYGVHVRVGDQVTTRIAPGADITDVLREARITWTVDAGLEVTPVVGERSDDTSTVLHRVVSQLARGIRDLKAGR